MRRSFNKKILPKNAPEKGSQLSPKKKKVRKSSLIRDLLWDWRRQAGEEFDMQEFADAVGVHKGTAKRWFYGYVPSNLSHWPIARYFAPYTNCTADILHDDLNSTWIDWKLGR